MKKALSLFLAMLMILSCFAVSSFAAPVDPTKWFDGNIASTSQAIVAFNTNGGTVRDGQFVLNPNTLQKGYESDITGTFYIVPTVADTESMTPGTKIQLPYCVPGDKTIAFVGWEVVSCPNVPEIVGNVYAGSTAFTIPQGANNTVIQFVARYTTTTIEPDSMTKIMDILVKVFGAILGLVMYKGDTELGVATMQKILGGILG